MQLQSMEPGTDIFTAEACRLTDSRDLMVFPSYSWQPPAAMTLSVLTTTPIGRWHRPQASNCAPGEARAFSFSLPQKRAQSASAFAPRSM